MTCPEHIRYGPSEEDKKRWAEEDAQRMKEMFDEALKPVARKKSFYVGAPACFALEEACQFINRAFGGFGCYLVGSALERPDWRDIDVRLIMRDQEFAELFPDAGPLDEHRWEFDPRWILLTVAISERLSKQTGLPVDFQFQPQTHANDRHKGPRNALGLRFAKGDT